MNPSVSKPHDVMIGAITTTTAATRARNLADDPCPASFMQPQLGSLVKV